MKKKALLVGGFNKTATLGQSLLNKGYKVTIINDNYLNCKALSENKDFNVFYGDQTKSYVLEDSLAAENNIVIAMTARDEDNLVICELCKRRFGVAKAVALVNDPKKADFFYMMGVDSVVCAADAITSVIEHQAFLDDMESFIRIGKGNIKLAEVPIPKTSPVVDKKIWEVNLPKEVIIGCIVRGDISMIPRGDTRLMAGDILVLISTKEQQIEAIRELAGGEI